MRLICPACGAISSAEAALVDEDARHTIAALAALPDGLGAIALRYLGLHRAPGSKQGLPWRKARRLAEELRELVTTADIQWKGKRIHRNNPAHWRQALEEVLNMAEAGKIERPLDGHNYLRAVAYDRADKGSEQDLRDKERACQERRPEPRPTDHGRAQDGDDQGPVSFADAFKRNPNLKPFWRRDDGEQS